MACASTDPRSQRSRDALRDALADEVRASGDLSRVTVTAVAERAGLTRRTFYSHYKDIPDLVQSIEDEALADIGRLVQAIADSNLGEVFASIDDLQPAPGSVELLSYFKEHGSYLAPLLGPGGDPGFTARIKDAVHAVFARSALHGIDQHALGAFFDYYITFAVSAEWGVVQRWLAGGMAEPVPAMARLMTLLMFVRPGDLYHHSHEMNIPAYGLSLMLSLENTDD